MEQLQAMCGDIPGFQMPDMSAMQEQIQAQMQMAMPNLNEIQAQQAAMGTLGDISPDLVAQAGSANMAYAGQVMQSMMDGSLEQELRELDDEANALLGGDWQIRRSGAANLTPAQSRLLAFGAPLLVYNDECVDRIATEVPLETIRGQLESWWNVTDRDSTIETAGWLLHEGHHAEADEALEALLHPEAATQPEAEYEKMDDVKHILQYMLQNHYCTRDTLPRTAIGWDLVRLSSVARWTYLCGYISEDEMWQIMQVAAKEACRTFSSWSEFGLSYAFGRGIWHGDTDECEDAYQIASLLLENPESPWRQIDFKAAEEEEEQEKDQWSEAYEANPHVFEREDDTLMVNFTLTDTVDTILPEEPEKLYAVDGKEISLWVLTFFSYNDEQNIASVEYHAALQALQEYVVEKRDGHVLVRGLSIEEMKQILNQL